jgi:5-methylcytosine-specific restriction protein A
LIDAPGFCASHAKQRQAEAVARRQADPAARAMNRLYTAAGWRSARAAFLSEHPLCSQCDASGRVTAATVVDHIKPHKGDLGLFWQRSNWQPLCGPCHSRKTAGGDGGFGNAVRAL